MSFFVVVRQYRESYDVYGTKMSLFLVSAYQQNRTVENKEKNEISDSTPIINPVLPGDRPDPTVIKVGDHYYASATSNEWARNNFWAPELAYDESQGKLYAYYTARNKDSYRLSVTRAINYQMVSTINLDNSGGRGGILLVGAAHNGFGAPVAGVGVEVDTNGLRVFESRNGEKKSWKTKPLI